MFVIGIIVMSIILWVGGWVGLVFYCDRFKWEPAQYVAYFAYPFLTGFFISVASFFVK